MNTAIKRSIDGIRARYGAEGFIPLHAPWFTGNEKKYLNECVDSTFVSSVGKFVTMFEEQIEQFTGAKKAVAVVNGTNALHLALRLVGVVPGDEVITQPLTFVATTNAITYEHAFPVFVDVDRDTLGLSPNSLSAFLDRWGDKRPDGVYNKTSGRRLAAIVPMHTFGHPVRIREIITIANEWGIPVVEDAAESLGSFAGGIHTGLMGRLGVLSFNGNKTITTGGGGMIITNDEALGARAKHLSTTAKVPSRWEFFHDEIGFNYRMPNINAALGCAQMEKLPEILENKRETAEYYRKFFSVIEGIDFLTAREGTRANYWLNAVILPSREDRDTFLKATNDADIQTRPVWVLQNKLPMYNNAQCFEVSNAEWLEDRVVNIPSSVVV